MSRSREYHTWIHMIYRCEKPRDPSYERYGARGIKVCDRWRGSIEAFIEDMGRRPPGMTLDRYPDKDGDYEPGNCRWATITQQQNNTRVNVILEHDGRRQSVAEWARELGMHSRTLKSRLDSGQSVAEALVIPVAPRRWETPRIILEHDGRRMTLSEWAKETGMASACIRHRLRRGWSVADALTKPAMQFRKPDAREKQR